MGESRRLRTQAERSGEAWRQVADTRPGYATYPTSRPGDPSWWRRANPSLGIPVKPEVIARARHVPGNNPSPECMASLLTVHKACDNDMGCTCSCHLPPPVDGETCKQWCGYCHLPPPDPKRVEEMRAAVAESAETGQPVLLADGSATITAPRRRWWHRYTRALAGRWWHVLGPGFLGELFNDVRHRYTRRNP